MHLKKEKKLNKAQQIPKTADSCNNDMLTEVNGAFAGDYF